MQVAVIAVGRVKERYWTEALREYEKRLSAYVDLTIHEVADEPAPETMSDADRMQVLRREGDKIEKLIRPRDGIILLDIGGKTLSSEAWSDTFAGLQSEGFGRLVFVIGGSNGIHPDIRAKARLRWSFGPITLPHQLARVVLLEQLYRGVKILRGEPYHK
ncbi:23S rRNA (pseudouridine(1915)-N(3))-methyltransferase RlmH [Alicyclobacillus acidiphilus]|uniref:23S rRNA (pseudouridine(1915)-N(3))-methyltransferase RlmH n=1 Tax=Alicyclobacillus acidiphilus TaxID=182455 RepID=UPI00082E279B|nr:23S rRNA (pseudouridine(1915)-N(3))-methyltransferase RlmH [Alicyclobacillus acidiphilus]